MDECSMTVIVHMGSHCALTSASKTHMISLTSIVLVNFVANLVCTFRLKSNRLDNVILYWMSINEIQCLGLVYDPYDPCTYTVILSCLTMWRLKSSWSWPVERYVHKVRFREITHPELQFAYLLLGRCTSRHYFFIQISFPYANVLERWYAPVQ